MTESDAEPTVSLIQQRIALGRRRVLALFLTIGWGILTIGRLTSFDVSNPVDWAVTAGSFGIFVWGGVLLIRVRRDARAFEERHGDAGRQK